MFFTKEAVALDYDCDASNRLKVSAAMRYMQQTSGEHLNWLGLPYEKLFEENMVFLMSKGCLKIFDMPVCGQSIIVGTAAVAIRGARFVREFVINDLNGNRMISALTLWLLVDPKTRRILRPASFPYPLPFQDSSIKGDIDDIDLPKSQPDAEETITNLTIRYSHMDYNNHVNNSMYADFVCDAMPFGELLEKGLDTLVISYQNEAKWGDSITMRTRHIADGQYHIHGQKDGGAPCFEALATMKNSIVNEHKKV